jgi:hypothetical protein
MSGRQKGPQLTSAEEVREATRAMHEAIKGMREAARDGRVVLAELQAAHDQIHAMFNSAVPDTAGLLAEMRDSAVTSYVEECNRINRLVTEAIDEWREEAKNAESRMAGFAGYDDAMEFIAGKTIGAVREGIDTESFVQRVANAVITKLQDKAEALGVPMSDETVAEMMSELTSRRVPFPTGPSFPTARVPGPRSRP